MKKVLSMLFHLLPVSWQIRFKKEVSLMYNHAGYGDTLMVGAVAREIKRKYGNVSITVNRVKEDLLRNNPNVDSTGERYNGIDLNYHYGSIFVGRRFEKNIIEVMCERAGVKKPLYTVDIYLTEDERNYARSVMTELKKPVITIHTTPGAFDNGRKLWPQKYWIELVKQLASMRCTIVQVGGPEEIGVTGVHDFLGKQDVRHTIAIVNEADMHIGVVSSLMHGAEAVKTPAIILYGGFERYANHGYKSIIPVESNISCAPCIEANTVIEKCSQNNQCMKDITPDMVIEKVKNALAIPTE